MSDLFEIFDTPETTALERKKYLAFRERLLSSESAVLAVAEYLQAKGLQVDVPPVRVTPNVREAKNFFDQGDIFIVIGDRRRRIEVKGSKKTFKSAEQWPFDNMFVSSVAAADRAPDILAYFTVSVDFQNAGIIYGRTRGFWYVANKRAPNTGRVETNYACPIQHVKFVGLR